MQLAYRYCIDLRVVVVTWCSVIVPGTDGRLSGTAIGVTSTTSDVS